jgi:hypothetical protein
VDIFEAFFIRVVKQCKLAVRRLDLTERSGVSHLKVEIVVWEIRLGRRHHKGKIDTAANRKLAVRRRRKPEVHSRAKVIQRSEETEARATEKQVAESISDNTEENSLRCFL